MILKNHTMTSTQLLLPTTGMGGTGAAAGIETTAEVSGEIDAALPLSLQQLLQNEWLQQNMSQMLNITKDNLDSLLITVAQQHQQHHQQYPHHHNATVGATAAAIFNGTTLLLDQQQQQNAEADAQAVISMPLTITLTTFYALIFVAGVLGNLITCFVISKCKFMHTATNFYLFNLAVSDLILLLAGLPQEVYDLWYPYSYPPSDALCVMESVLSETAANATVLTITAFTVERYIAICHPFRQHTMSKLSRAIKFIFAIWIMAFLLALPQAMQFSVVKQPDGGTACTMENHFFVHVFTVSGFIFFGGPMTAICVLYVLIGVKLKRSRMLQAMPRRAYDLQRGISAQGRVIRMLVAVAVAFFICWAPFHTQRLTAAYASSAGINSQAFNYYFRILDSAAGLLYFLSTCINPLLYNIMSHKFREAFKVTLARHFGLAGMYHAQNRNYSALLRQNGSIRLHTTVNNNALEQFSSYRIVQLQCRDPSHHHLSLQDSIRTTITTTTINSATGGGGSGGGGGCGGGNTSCRSSVHRNRCISIGSKGAMNSGGVGGGCTGGIGSGGIIGGNGVNAMATTSGIMKNGGGSMIERPRLLHKQISQLSSVGDANSLLEVDACGSYHRRDMKRATIDPGGILSGSDGDGSGGVGVGIGVNDCDDAKRRAVAAIAANEQQRRHSLNSCVDWEESVRQQSIVAMRTPSLDTHETQLYSGGGGGNSGSGSGNMKSNTVHQTATEPTTPSTFTAVNSIAELNQPSRSRLKLSRIISRRERSPFLVQTSSPRTEIIQTPVHATHTLAHTPHTASTTNMKKKKVKKSSKLMRTHRAPFSALTDKLHWRFWRKTEARPSNGVVEADTRQTLMHASATGADFVGTPQAL